MTGWQRFCIRAAALMWPLPLWAAPAKPQPQRLQPQQIEQLIDLGIRQMREQAYAEAIHTFLYLQRYAPQNTRSAAFAQNFLAESLASANLHYLSSLFDVMTLKARLSPETIDSAAVRLEKQFSANLLHEDLLQDLAEEDAIGVVTPAAYYFLQYHKGVAALRLGRVDWAQTSFASIPSSLPLHVLSQFVLGLWEMKTKQWDHAEKSLQTLWRQNLPQSSSAPVYRMLAEQVPFALARWHFDRHRYRRALQLYDSVHFNQLDSLQQSEWLVEQAFAYYFLQDYSQTLGRLQALFSPQFADIFFPEKYLLAALALRAQCHYFPAKQKIRDFELDYHSVFQMLKERQPKQRIVALRNRAILELEKGNRAHLLRQLDAEAMQLSKLPIFESSKIYLQAMLAQRSQMLEKMYEQRLQAWLDELANQFLQVRSQLKALDFEIDLALQMPDKSHRNNALSPYLTEPAAIFYPFVDEYWNDEIKQLMFQIHSICGSQWEAP